MISFINKKIIFACFLAGTILFTSGGFVHAQSDTTKKALESVKESVDTLIGVKDENNPNDAAFRVEAFKKVLDFSVAEAKDLRVKLLASFENETSSTAAWKDGAVKKIDAALVYYADEQNMVKKNPSMTLGQIKTAADDFKTWREDTYLPLSEEVTDFLFIKQQAKALAITIARGEKINEDVLKLEKAFGTKKIQPLKALLEKASSSTEEAENLNSQARVLFTKRYVFPLFATSSVATSTEAGEGNATSSVATSTETNDNTTDTLRINTDAFSSSSATSSIATSTPLLIPPASIKDLVRASLIKVKGAYQVFIEMSDLVRKLLG